MSSIQPYRPSAIEARRISRGLSRLAVDTGLAVAAIEAAAEKEAADVDGIAYVGQRAMQNIALLTQMEQQLATAVPLAASRLQAIGDMTALGMADVVAGAVRKLGRR